MSYREKLAELIEIERKAVITQMQREISTLTAEERERLGRCLIITKKPKLVNRTLTEYIYRFYTPKAKTSEFASGSIVSYSNYESKEDLQVKGVVWERTGNTITIAFSQKLPNYKKARVDLIVDETVFERMRKGLSRISYKLLKILLGEEELEQVYIPYEETKLNDSQKECISYSLESRLSLIHGPFGTGKTTVIKVLAEELVKRGYRVLITAESNNAVDNIAERLLDSGIKMVRYGHPARLNSRISELSIENQIKGYQDYSKLRALMEEIEILKNRQEREGVKPAPKYKRGLSDSEILRLAKQGVPRYRGVPGKIIKGMAKWIELQMEINPRMEAFKALYDSLVKRTIKNSKIVLSTNIGSYSDYLIDERFDVVIIDEGTQATEPSVILPMTLAKRYVLAGDHKQLPPTVVSNEPELKVSLFERLVKLYPHLVHMLKVQYRMNETLMGFPSKEFYDGKLKADDSVRNIRLSDIASKSACPIGGDIPLVAIHVGTRESRKTGSKSRINEGELIVTREVAEKMIQCVGKDNVGVITPYKDQREALKDLECEVNTVDGFQGREKEVIIITLVRSNSFGNLGFLTDYRRLNVAITRAKRKLIVIGNLNTIGRDPVYKRFVEYIEDKGLILDEQAY